MNGRLRRAAAGAAAAASLCLMAACGDGEGGGGGDTKAGWQEDHGDLFDAYSRDLSAVVNTINQGERTATLATCQQVIDDGKELKDTALPVPNPAVDGPLRTAIEKGASGGNSCLAGARNTDARAVEAAQRDFADARKAMDEAEAAYKAWT